MKIVSIAVLGHQFGGGLVAHDLAAAANVNVGAEAQKPRGHRLTQAGATAGDKDIAARKKLWVEHGRSLILEEDSSLIS